jgi:hypothetical protein
MTLHLSCQKSPRLSSSLVRNLFCLPTATPCQYWAGAVMLQRCDHEHRNPYEQRPNFRSSRCASGAGRWHWRPRGVRRDCRRTLRGHRCDAFRNGLERHTCGVTHYPAPVNRANESFSRRRRDAFSYSLLLARAQHSRPGFQSFGVGSGPHQSPIRIKAVINVLPRRLRPWPPWRPQKTVGALHVSMSCGLSAADSSMVARGCCGERQPRVAHGRGEPVKLVAFQKHVCPAFLPFHNPWSGGEADGSPIRSDGCRPTPCLAHRRRSMTQRL